MASDKEEQITIMGVEEEQKRCRRLRDGDAVHPRHNS